MTYRGRVENGVVVPESGAELPEGAEVRIDVASVRDASKTSVPPNDQNAAATTSFYERYKSIIGVIKDLPPDASERVDQDLYDRDER